MKIKFVLLAFVFVFLLLTPTFAETSIKAEVNKTKITTDEALAYKIIITSSEKKLPSPELPKFTGFKIISQARSTAASLVKKEIKSTLVYAFILAPINIGKFKIPPASIKIKNKAYSTDAFEIEVIPGKARPQKIHPASKEPQTTL